MAERIRHQQVSRHRQLHDLGNLQQLGLSCTEDQRGNFRWRSVSDRQLSLSCHSAHSTIGCSVAGLTVCNFLPVAFRIRREKHTETVTETYLFSKCWCVCSALDVLTVTV